MEVGWTFHRAGIEHAETGMLKSGHLLHGLFLEVSAARHCLPDDSAGLCLPVQGLCFSLKEEHEKTCRAMKRKIYVLCKWIFPLHNNNKPNTGSFMGVGDLLGDMVVLVEEPKGHFLFLLCNKNTLSEYTVCCCQKGKGLTSVLLLFMMSRCQWQDEGLRTGLPIQGRYLRISVGFSRTEV